MRFLAKNSNFTPLFLGYGRIFGSFSLFYAHIFGIIINVEHGRKVHMYAQFATFARHFDSIAIEQSLVGDGAEYHIYHLNRLDEEQDSASDEHLVRSLHQRNEEESEHRIGAEYVAVVEEQVNEAPDEEEYHSPGEARTEVNTSLLLIVMLDVAAEAEKQRENRVHLARSEEEDRVPDSLVEGCRLRHGHKVHVLKEVDNDDAANGEAAKAIHKVNSVVSGQFLHI